MRPMKIAFTDQADFSVIFKPLRWCAAACFFLSCAASQGSISDQNAQNASLYRTFSVKGAIRTGAADPLFAIPGLDLRVRLEIEAGLEATGLRLVKDAPELTVYYYFGVESTDRLFPLPYRIGARSSSFMMNDHTKHRLGERFSIDLVDTRLNEVIWSGTDSTLTSATADQADKVSQSIRQILRKFPS